MITSLKHQVTLLDADGCAGSIILSDLYCISKGGILNYDIKLTQ